MRHNAKGLPHLRKYPTHWRVWYRYHNDLGDRDRYFVAVTFELAITMAIHAQYLVRAHKWRLELVKRTKEHRQRAEDSEAQGTGAAEQI